MLDMLMNFWTRGGTKKILVLFLVSLNEISSCTRRSKVNSSKDYKIIHRGVKILFLAKTEV